MLVLAGAGGLFGVTSNSVVVEVGSSRCSVEEISIVNVEFSWEFSVVGLSSPDWGGGQSEGLMLGCVCPGTRVGCALVTVVVIEGALLGAFQCESSREGLVGMFTV